MSRPSVLAGLGFTASSYLTGACTGDRPASRPSGCDGRRGTSPPQIDRFEPVADQAAITGVMAERINGRKPEADRQSNDPLAKDIVYGRGEHDQAPSRLLCECRDSGLDIVLGVVKSHSDHLQSRCGALNRAPNRGKSLEGRVQDAGHAPETGRQQNQP